MKTWNFFTNYGHVIILLGINPDLTLREISLRVGITERSTQKIISDLEADGFLKIGKRGRQNSYKIVGRKKLKHEVEKTCRLESIIQLMKGT